MMTVEKCTVIMLINDPKA